MYIINPDFYNSPCYRIGPFRTSDISFNHELPESNFIDDYFDSRFGGKQYMYTQNGRTALNIALNYYKLKSNDVVTILTTTGNFYISSCVTNEIEKFCLWSREIVSNTKLILINHEFGYPYENLELLVQYNIPIIEDCAGSFFTMSRDHKIGQVGDFVIYSFPKMFPIQIGGLLVANLPNPVNVFPKIRKDYLRYIRNVLSYYIKLKGEIIEKRLNNHEFLVKEFETLGLIKRFELDFGAVPAVFMFRTSGHNMNLDILKKYFYSNGVQCSVFYGEQSFFIPVHQALNTQDLEYFYEIMKSFKTGDL